MVTQLQSPDKSNIIYPDDNGEQMLEQERSQALESRLREMGIDPNQL